MSFETGMQLGADALYRGADFGLRRRAEDRNKEKHDWDMQMLREAEERQKAAAALLDPDAALTPTPLAPPAGVTVPATGSSATATGVMPPQNSIPAQATPPTSSPTSTLGVRKQVARQLRNFDAYFQAQGEIDTVERNQRYNDIRQRAQEGDPQLLALVNLRSPNTTVLKGENGYEYVSVSEDGTASKYQLSPYELGQLAVANAMMADGDLAGGYKVAESVNKEIAASLQQRFTNAVNASGANNQATRYGNQDTNDAGRLAETTRHNQAMEGLRGREVRTQESNAAASRRQIQLFQDGKGNMVMLDVAALPTGRDGTMQIPEGLRPANAREAFSPKAYADVLKQFAEIYPNDPARARMETDALFGMGPKDTDLADPELQKANESRGGGTAPGLQVPARNVAFSPAAYERFLDGARRGDATSLGIIKGWRDANLLTAGQRQAVERLVGTPQR